MAPGELSQSLGVVVGLVVLVDVRLKEIFIDKNKFGLTIFLRMISGGGVGGVGGRCRTTTGGGAGGAGA